MSGAVASSSWQLRPFCFQMNALCLSESVASTMLQWHVGLNVAVVWYVALVGCTSKLHWHIGLKVRVGCSVKVGGRRSRVELQIRNAKHASEYSLIRIFINDVIHY